MSQNELRIDVVPPGSFSYLAQSSAAERLPTPEMECTTNRVECSRLETPIYSYKVAFPRLIPESPTLTDDDKETFLRSEIPCELLYDRDGVIYTTNKWMVRLIFSTICIVRLLENYFIRADGGLMRVLDLSFAGVTHAKKIPCMAELEEIPAANNDYATVGKRIVLFVCLATLAKAVSFNTKVIYCGHTIVNLPTPTPASNIDTKAYAETAALMH
jgi:hypothetical protein